MQLKELHKNQDFPLVKAEMASDKPNKGSVHTNTTSAQGTVTNNMTLGNSNRSTANKRLRSASLQLLYNKVQSSMADRGEARRNGNKRLKVSFRWTLFLRPEIN